MAWTRVLASVRRSMSEFVIGAQQIRPLEVAVPATVKTRGAVQSWPLTLGAPHTQRRVLGGERQAGTHAPK